ncbi:MAG: hypothetical protein ACI3ZJ_06675 [Bacteroidaceae bacterium]
MKKIKIKWLVWTSKVLSSMVAMLGLSSCFFQPSMYGVPNPNWNPDSMATDSTSTDSAKRYPQKELRVMYGVRPAPFRRNEIDKGGVEIEIKQD